MQVLFWSATHTCEPRLGQPHTVLLLTRVGLALDRTDAAPSATPGEAGLSSKNLFRGHSMDALGEQRSDSPVRGRKHQPVLEGRGCDAPPPRSLCTPAHPCAPLRTPAHPCAPLHTPAHPGLPHCAPRLATLTRPGRAASRTAPRTAACAPACPGAVRRPTAPSTAVPRPRPPTAPRRPPRNASRHPSRRPSRRLCLRPPRRASRLPSRRASLSATRRTLQARRA